MESLVPERELHGERFLVGLLVGIFVHGAITKEQQRDLREADEDVQERAGDREGKQQEAEEKCAGREQRGEKDEAQVFEERRERAMASDGSESECVGLTGLAEDLQERHRGHETAEEPEAAEDGEGDEHTGGLPVEREAADAGESEGDPRAEDLDRRQTLRLPPRADEEQRKVKDRHGDTLDQGETSKVTMVEPNVAEQGREEDLSAKDDSVESHDERRQKGRAKVREKRKMKKRSAAHSNKTRDRGWRELFSFNFTQRRAWA
jgi:hypothetical protein